MEKTGDTAERFTLCAFAAAWRAKENERLVFHERNFFYKTNSTIWATVVPYSLVIPSYVEGSRCATLKLVLTSDVTSPPPDRHSLVVPPGRSAHSHRPAQKWCSHDPARHFFPAKILFPVAAQ